MNLMPLGDRLFEWAISSFMYVLTEMSVPMKIAETYESDLRERSSTRTFLSPLS